MAMTTENIQYIEEQKRFIPPSCAATEALLDEAIALLKLQHNYIVELENNSKEVIRLIKDFKLPE